MAATNISRKLAKQYKQLREHNGELFDFQLEGECIDNWLVTYKFPKARIPEIKLRFTFSLVQDLPPKVTVISPKEVPYVCFQELGTTEWNSQSDLTTLALALRAALGDRHGLNAPSSGSFKAEIYTPEESEKQWAYVRDAHSDWKMPDITALNKAVEALTLTTARAEALQELKATQVEASSSKPQPCEA